MFVSGSESLGNSVPVYCSGSTSFDVRSWKISLKNFQGLLSIVQLSMFFFVVAVSCDSFYIISKHFMFVNNFFISFLLLWSSSSRDSLFRIAYSSRLVNSFLISFCNLLFSKFSSEYSHTHARIFMQNFFIFHPLCLCMPLLSLCLDQRTNVILPRLSGIVNVVFIFCAIQNILTFLRLSSVLRLSKLFPYSPESESLKTFNFYNFVIAMIPGSKGQKADASLLARGFLTSWPAKNMSK